MGLIKKDIITVIWRQYSCCMFMEWKNFEFLNGMINGIAMLTAGRAQQQNQKQFHSSLPNGKNGLFWFVEGSRPLCGVWNWRMKFQQSEGSCAMWLSVIGFGLLFDLRVSGCCSSNAPQREENATKQTQWSQSMEQKELIWEWRQLNQLEFLLVDGRSRKTKEMDWLMLAEWRTKLLRSAARQRQQISNSFHSAWSCERRNEMELLCWLR